MSVFEFPDHSDPYGAPMKNESKLNWRIHFINKAVEITKAIVLHTSQRPKFFR